MKLILHLWIRQWRRVVFEDGMLWITNKHKDTVWQVFHSFLISWDETTVKHFTYLLFLTTTLLRCGFQGRNRCQQNKWSSHSFCLLMICCHFPHTQFFNDITNQKHCFQTSSWREFEDRNFPHFTGWGETQVMPSVLFIILLLDVIRRGDACQSLNASVLIVHRLL